MKFSQILSSALTFAGLISLASAFSASGNDNVVVYWGQNSAGSQESLDTYCKSDAVDIVVLSFMTTFPGTNGQPELNLVGCYDTFPGTTLLHCSDIASQIKTCQGLGKKVILSLGGAVGNYGFSSNSEAADFAGTLWNMFLGGTSTTRPFDDAVLDGIDLDIENQNPTGYATMITTLRSKYFSQDTSKDYYISAAPQCVYPDASVGDAMANAVIDFAFVQFYNNPCSVSGTFNYDTWTKYAAGSPNPNIKIYLGLPGSTKAAGSGYLSFSDMEAAIAKIQNDANFGGVMFWDASQAFANTNSANVNYAVAAKNALALGTGSGSATNTAASSSPKASTSTSSTQSQESSSAILNVQAYNKGVETQSSSSVVVSSISLVTAATSSSVPTVSSSSSETTVSSSSSETTVTSIISTRTETLFSTMTTSIASSSSAVEASSSATLTSSQPNATASVVANIESDVGVTLAQSSAAAVTAPSVYSLSGVKPTVTVSDQSTPDQCRSLVGSQLANCLNSFYAAGKSSAQATFSYTATAVGSASPTTTSTDAAATTSTDAAATTGSDAAATSAAAATSTSFSTTSGTCVDGNVGCSPEGDFILCNYGSWVHFVCPPGTSCYAFADSPEGDAVIACDFTRSSKRDLGETVGDSFLRDILVR